MTAVGLTIAGVLVLTAAWLRAAGSAIARVPRADALRDEADGVAGAGAVAQLLDERESLSPAVGVVGSALLVIGAVVATAMLADATGGGIAIAFGVGLIAFLIGDLVPRWLGRVSPRTLAYRSHVLLRWSIRLGGWATELIPEAEHDEDPGEEGSDEEGDEQERELIDSVLEFTETIVREVMTPRPDMVTIPVTGTIRELIALSTGSGYSRVPVTSNGDVVGMVIVKDLLKMVAEDEFPDSVAEVMRPVEFVPETKLAAALLGEMQESHTHQVIVVDEYGDVVGLVTIEDLLEELVGEIADETDSEEALIVAKGDGWWIDARLPVTDFYKLTGVESEEEHEGDTVGGLVMDLAERVPEEGETFAIEHVELTVTRMQGRRVAEVTAVATSRAETA